MVCLVLFVLQDAQRCCFYGLVYPVANMKVYLTMLSYWNACGQPHCSVVTYSCVTHCGSVTLACAGAVPDTA